METEGKTYVGRVWSHYIDTSQFPWDFSVDVTDSNGRKRRVTAGDVLASDGLFADQMWRVLAEHAATEINKESVVNQGGSEEEKREAEGRNNNAHEALPWLLSEH